MNGIRGRVIQAAGELFGETLERRGLGPAEVGGAEPLAVGYVDAGEPPANRWLDHPGESPEAMTARLINIGWVGLEGLVTGRRWRSAG